MDFLQLLSDFTKSDFARGSCPILDWIRQSQYSKRVCKDLELKLGRVFFIDTGCRARYKLLHFLHLGQIRV